jgi:hypothetical protein
MRNAAIGVVLTTRSCASAEKLVKREMMPPLCGRVSTSGADGSGGLAHAHKGNGDYDAK